MFSFHRRKPIRNIIKNIREHLPTFKLFFMPFCLRIIKTHPMSENVEKPIRSQPVVFQEASDSVGEIRWLMFLWKRFVNVDIALFKIHVVIAIKPAQMCNSIRFEASSIFIPPYPSPLPLLYHPTVSFPSRLAGYQFFFLLFLVFALMSLFEVGNAHLQTISFSSAILNFWRVLN